VVVHTVILALGRLRQEDPEFKASLGYIVRSYFKNQKRMTGRKEERKEGR
jgi:hypothetical protein